MAKPSSGTLLTTGLGSGIIMCVPFWEGTGTSPTELVTSSGPSASTDLTWSTGDEGPVGVFNGSSTKLTYTGIAACSAMTIAIRFAQTTSASNFMWIERESVNSTWQLMSAGNQQFGLKGGSGGYRIYVADGAYPYDGTYQLIVVTDSGSSTSSTSNGHAWVNGSAKTNGGDDSTPPASNTNAINVGCYGDSGGGFFFPGTIDWIIVWNREITPTEAGNLYTGGLASVITSASGNRINRVICSGGE